MTTLGLLHPGAMGSSLGACARLAGTEVVWASEGRSDATRARADADGLHDVATLDHLAQESDVVLCVCPPSEATAVARSVAQRRFGGLYIDANAVSPETARVVAGIVEGAGARFADGGIVGPPARGPGRCVLYTSGSAAEDVAPLFAGSDVDVVSLGPEVAAASAMKMAFAAYTKGHSALLLNVRALARASGVEAPLLAHWKRTHPQLDALSQATARGTAAKAWRFAGEMEEIAATFAASDLPDGFHLAAARVYERMASLADAPEPTLDDVLRAILQSSPDRDAT